METALYLDSSAIVKFYTHEPHYQNVRQWAQDANILVTSEIAYTEVVSAFSQKVWSGEKGQKKITVECLPIKKKYGMALAALGFVKFIFPSGQDVAVP